MRTTTEFVPGPYQMVTSGHDAFTSVEVQTREGFILATVGEYALLGPGATPEAERNATLAQGHLFAAAPDLYEALKGVLRYFADAERLGGYAVPPHPNCPTVVAARAAVAKAESGAV